MTADEIQDAFDSLKHPRIALTKWEEDFLDSVYSQFSRKGYLSEKQCDILERIVQDRA